MSWRFITCAALFVTCLLTANIIAAKLIVVGGVVLTAGIVIFPLSYVLGDVLTEVWGYAAARRVIWLGFACNAVMVLAIWLGGELPVAPFGASQFAYDEILGQTPRILLASFAAYLVGEFANAFVLAKMKIATRGRWLWMRTIGSTVVGQALDSAVFVTLAFWGTMPGRVLTGVVVGQWIAKVVYEAAGTPLVYAVVGWLKAREGVDVYDERTDFNPVHLRG
jgi:uncharacterized integral membrane protein (TIGR00697 family)